MSGKGLGKYGLGAKYSLTSIFVNKVLLAHSEAYSLTYC